MLYGETDGYALGACIKSWRINKDDQTGSENAPCFLFPGEGVTKNIWRQVWSYVKKQSCLIIRHIG
jgi:hypothetical protein